MSKPPIHYFSTLQYEDSADWIKSRFFGHSFEINKKDLYAMPPDHKPPTPQPSPAPPPTPTPVATAFPTTYTDPALLASVREELGLNAAKAYATFSTPGLTKREWFASNAQQALIAKNVQGTSDDIARRAVEHANALIFALRAATKKV